ncbi:MAG: hypothetical protein U0271_13385 [Polyangiaceae bacterium]
MTLIKHSAIALLVTLAACGSADKDQDKNERDKSDDVEPGKKGARSAVSQAPMAPSDAPRKPSSAGITISPGGVSGGAALHGDPKACASFHACCDAALKTGPSDMLGLTCGLAQAAADGLCEDALGSVRSSIREQKMSAPPGCLD